MKVETDEKMMETRRRRGIISPRLRSKVVIIPLALIFAACASWYVSVARVPVIPVTVTEAHRGALIASFPAAGTISPKDQMAAQSRIAGTIKKMYVKDGDAVKKGDVLVELDAELIENQITQAESGYLIAKANLTKLSGSTQNSAIESAKANVKQAQLTLDEAARNVKSSKILYDAKAIAREQLDTVKSAYEKAKLALEQAKKQVRFAQTQVTSDDKDAAQAQLRQAELNLQNAQKQLDYVRITAPLSGKVNFQTQGLLGAPVQAQLREGMMVSPEMTLCYVVDVENLQVRANVDELQAKDIRPGQQVEIKPESYPNKALTGHIVKVGTQTTQQSGISTVEVLMDVGDKEGLDLKMGSNVDVSIITSYRSRALIIPHEAIKEENGKHVVYVVKRTKQSLPSAQKKVVSTGLETSQGVEVLSGLLDGEKVIIKSAGQLKDKIRVKITD